MWRFKGVLFLACVLFGMAAQAQDAAKAWDAFTAQFIEEHIRLNPDSAVYEGRHEFDGQLPNFSRAGLEKPLAFYRSTHAAALKFDPAQLDTPRQIEHESLLARCEREIFYYEEVEAPFKNPAYYTGAFGPDVYLTREYAPLEQRLAAYIKHMHAVAAAVPHMKANVRTPIPRPFLNLARMMAGGLVEFIEADVPGIFAPVKDDALQAQLKEANATAVAALKEADTWLAGEEPKANEDFAMGAERYQKMLWVTERIDLPLARFKEIADADLNRNLKDLEAACKAYDPGKSIAACVAEVNAAKADGGPVATATAQLPGLKKFLLDNEIVSIPGTQEALVGEAPPYKRWNSAYIEIPGPYEKNLPSVYYIAPPDPKWSPQEQLDYIPGEAGLLNTTVHEVWPGHFLHFLHAQRAESMFNRLFVGYAFSEGWAHYTEEMMVEAGLAEKNPALRIAQILDALLRDVRYLSSIGLHTEGMTVEESETMFREKAWQDAGNARQQAARGTFDPQYYSYTVGKLMILKLREDWTASRGGRKAWKEFHDTLLSYGGPPLVLVRKAMLGPDAGPPL
ncbi:MAG: DUF885 domain-containing protein [Candidatus Hydrogenedentes bacterium]|nr:DUF885 domain-containing protein [Candidatus Hydrogenedentota bacterium]